MSGSSSLYVIILPSLVTIGNVIAELCHGDVSLLRGLARPLFQRVM